MQNESTGAISSISFLGKSLSELKAITSSIKTKGIRDTFFNTPTINTTSVFKYNQAIKEATANGASLAEKHQIMKLSMENTNKATAQLIGTTNGAIVGIDALSEAQDQSTLAARAQASALKVLSAAGNMLLFWGVTKVLSSATAAIDNWIHRVEKARERTAELLQEFSEMRETHSNHKETVANYADRYDELSKGVDLSNNKNLSLSTEEYKEFLDINKQLSESFLTLKTNIDDNGNAILTLGTKGITAKEQLQELLDTEENLNNFKISQGLGEAFKGVYTYIEDANKAQEELNKINNKTDEQMGILPDYVENGVTLKKDNYQLFKGNTAEETKINYANTIQSAAQQFLDGLDDDRRIELESKGLNSSGLFTMVTDDLTGNFDFYANLYTLTPDEISSIENLISENITELNGALTDGFSAQKTELEEQVQAGKYAWADFLPNLVAGMKSKQTFQCRFKQ